MVKWKYLFVAVLILLLGTWGVLRLLPGEEKKIQKQFQWLAEYAAKGEGEAPFAAAQKIQSLGLLFGETCEFKTPFYSISGDFSREEISLLAGRTRAQFRRMELHFLDLTVSFPERDMAAATLTARLTGTLTNGESVNEPHELQCWLKKIDKHWYFSRLEVVEVLKR